MYCKKVDLLAVASGASICIILRHYLLLGLLLGLGCATLVALLGRIRRETTAVQPDTSIWSTLGFFSGKPQGAPDGFTEADEAANADTPVHRNPGNPLYPLPYWGTRATSTPNSDSES